MSTETERAECPTCHLAVEGQMPATITCGCGTTLSIHGGGPPITAVDAPRPARASRAAAELAGPAGVMGGRDYA